jgi:hypothetical protein
MPLGATVVGLTERVHRVSLEAFDKGSTPSLALDAIAAALFSYSRDYAFS